MVHDTTLQALDGRMVTEIARWALDAPRAKMVDWQIQTLRYDCTNPTSGGVYRVTGTAIEDEQTRLWSAILKVVRSPAGMVMPSGDVIPDDLPDDPNIFGYWKREALINGIGVLAGLPRGVAAPRCYGATAPEDNTLWIWQEDLAENDQARWSRDEYRLAARCLGRFNGAYLAGRPLPTYPWLAGGWLRSWVTLVGASMIEGIERSHAWEHPAVHSALPSSMVGRVQHLWEQRERLLAALESLPQVFCHRDAFRPNLFIRPKQDGVAGIVAIDWAFAGAGPVGEEIAPLITMQPAGGQECFSPRQLEAPVFGEYVRGLHDAGWHGDPQLVRFGYCASAALRYVWPTVAELVIDLRDERRHGAVAERRGMPFDQVVEQQVALTEYLLDLGDEALSQLSSMKYAELEQWPVAG